jgi:hypothetical protein
LTSTTMTNGGGASGGSYNAAGQNGSAQVVIMAV